MWAPFLQMLVGQKILNRFSLVWSRTLASTVRQKQCDHFPDSVCGVHKKELVPEVFPTQPCVRSYEGSCLRNSYDIEVITFIRLTWWWSTTIPPEQETNESTPPRTPTSCTQVHIHRIAHRAYIAKGNDGHWLRTAVQKRALGSLQKHVSPLVQVLLPLPPPGINTSDQPPSPNNQPPSTTKISITIPISTIPSNNININNNNNNNQ